MSTASLNYIQTNKFKVSIQKLPSVSFYATGINFPGLNVSPQSMPSPIRNYTLPSTKIDHDQFTLTFKVDEDLTNYKELFKWFHSFATDKTTDSLSYSPNISSNKKEYRPESDATVISLSNAGLPNIEVNIRDMYPISLSGLDFTTTDTSLINATVVFEYSYYEFN